MLQPSSHGNDDQIAVLDSGKVVEFGSPLSLLDKGEIFATMVHALGEVAASAIRKKAVQTSGQEGHTSSN
jgi:ABC-type transport system involved in cytochrome bd biosynthesis fused ATPase/permease subunit